jgi:hypothetical protein
VTAVIFARGPHPSEFVSLPRWRRRFEVVSSHRLNRATALLAQWRRLDTTLMTRARITPPNK